MLLLELCLPSLFLIILDSAQLGSNVVKFAFNVVDGIAPSPLFRRSGICTSRLNHICTAKGGVDTETLNEWRDVPLDDNITLEAFYKSPQSVVCPMFLRPSQPLALPTDPAVPIIMIAAGTGISPFIGFLEERYASMYQDMRTK